jgi:inner membrane protein
MPDLAELAATPWVWFIAATVLAIMEIVAPGIFMIWLAMAAAATGIATMMLDFGWQLQLVTFAVLAVAAVFAGRGYLKRNPVLTDDSGLNRRGERLVGEVVRVVDAIENGRGKVQVGDSPWLAEGPDAPAGAQVRVIGVEGATLIVERA